MANFTEMVEEKKEKVEETLYQNQDVVICVASLAGGVIATVGCFYAYYRMIRAGVRDGILASKR